jgi:hypothetical protein
MENKELLKDIIKAKKAVMFFTIEGDKKKAIREIYNNLYKSLRNDNNIEIFNIIKSLSALTQIQLILQDHSVSFSNGGIVGNTIKCGDLVNINFKEIG